MCSGQRAWVKQTSVERPTPAWSTATARASWSPFSWEAFQAGRTICSGTTCGKTLAANHLTGAGIFPMNQRVESETRRRMDGGKSKPNSTAVGHNAHHIVQRRQGTDKNVSRPPDALAVVNLKRREPQQAMKREVKPEKMHARLEWEQVDWAATRAAPKVEAIGGYIAIYPCRLEENKGWHVQNNAPCSTHQI